MRYSTKNECDAAGKFNAKSGTIFIHGMAFDDLRRQYFSVGVGDDLSDIPFHDMLLVFSMLEQQLVAFKKFKDKPVGEFSK